MYIQNINNNKTNFTAQTMPQKTGEYFLNKFLWAKSADIYCHRSPDEDTFATAKGLANLLKPLGVRVRIIVEDTFKKLYLQKSDKNFKIMQPQNLRGSKKAEVAIIVDTCQSYRLPEFSQKYLEKYDKSQIFVFDHHQPDMNGTVIGNKENVYLDTTAKSCSSILYRFFESIGVEPETSDLKNLWCGMISDLNKSKYLNISGLRGKPIITIYDKLNQSPLVLEVLNKVQNKIPQSDRKKIADHLNILAHLTTAEKSFRRKIFSKVQFSKNGKLAYAVIPQDDKEWLQLGQDTTSTSEILSDFRKRILANVKNDEFIPANLKNKLDEVQAAMVFYRGPKERNPKNEVYKVSIHSKNGYAQSLFNQIQKNHPELNHIGGHKDRKGGKIDLNGEISSTNFVKYFLEAAEEIN